MTNFDVTTAGYIFTIMGAFITLFGAVIIYLNKKSKLGKRKKYAN